MWICNEDEDEYNTVSNPIIANENCYYTIYYTCYFLYFKFESS